MPSHYYNECDPGAAEWLRGLIAAGLIPEGVVDARSITEVESADLRGFHAVHLFAGIGGWAYALRLAGWPDDRPVWTGSCPCQPFSAAGKGLGDKDPRHLWPHMFRLVRECRAECVFGEQVEGAIRRGWLDGICDDLEGEGYAVGSAVLGAHSLGAPHRRQRLYWVADAGHGMQRGPGEQRAGCEGAAGREHRQQPQDGRAGVALGDTSGPGLQERIGDGGVRRGAGRARPGQAPELSGDAGGFWSASDILSCRDGKARRVEPGTFPLAHGIPGRLGLLRGYGNAIVPQVAAAFVRAYCESLPCAS